MRQPRRRIKWFLSHRPTNESGQVAAGECLRHTWLATDIPPAGAYDAAAAYRLARDNGHLHRDSKAPLGAWLYWTGGSDGHGHTALAAKRRRIASTDVKGDATVGIVPQSYPETNWGLHYEGWSDWYGVTFTVGTLRHRKIAALRKRIRSLRQSIGKIKRHK